MENESNDVSRKNAIKSFLSNTFLFFFVSFVGVASDLGTKEWAFSSLGMPREYRWKENPELYGIYWVWEDIFGFQTSLNEGALFGMGQGKVFWLSILSGIALLAILGWFFHSARKSVFLSVTLGMIVAGIMGNLYDRLGLHALQWNYADEYHAFGEPVFAVRDWILVMIGSYHWPNFNIADSLLVCGTILLVLHSFLVQEPEIEPVVDSKKADKA